MRTLLAALSLASGLTALPCVASAACGEISIAEMNWASAGIAAHLDAFILEKGYGCRVTLVPGDTIPTFTSMTELGQPDLAPELWVNSVRKPLAAALKDGRLIEGAKILKDGGVEGWWIPKYIADAHPEIRTVQDALAHADLFADPADQSHGAINNCPTGWTCQISTANLFKAVKAQEHGFHLVEAASSAGLEDGIAAAFENKVGWLGYYWAPAPSLGRFDMVKLSFGTGHDRLEWERCTSVPDCPDPQVNGYPVSDVYTLATSDFADKAAETLGYIKARSWDNTTVNGLLAWMDESKATTADAARHVLTTQPDLWTPWVSPEAAEKIKAALAE